MSSKLKHSKRHTNGRLLQTHLKCTHLPSRERGVWGGNDVKEAALRASNAKPVRPQSAFDKKVRHWKPSLPFITPPLCEEGLWGDNDVKGAAMRASNVKPVRPQSAFDKKVRHWKPPSPS